MDVPATTETQLEPDLRVLPARAPTRHVGVAKVPVKTQLEFKDFLVSRMDTMGLTIAELVRLSGADNSTISNLRSGQAKPGIRVLRKLAKGLGMPLPELLVIAGLIEPEDWPEGKPSPALPPVIQDVLARLNPETGLSEKEKRMLQAGVRRALESFDEFIEEVRRVPIEGRRR